MVAIEVAAAKATEEPREGRARMKARVAASQIVRVGDWKRASTWWKKWGMPRSRPGSFVSEGFGGLGRFGG